MTGPIVIKHESPSVMADALSAMIEKICQEDIEQKGKACIVLPGGNSPKLLIAALAKRKIDWGKILITTTDERCVPFDNSSSNAGEIFRLFEFHGIKTNVSWLDVEQPDFPTQIPTTVTILGMGFDGHFASLFPDTQSFDSNESLINCLGPVEPKERISFTLKQFLNTNKLILLVNSEEKWEVCERAIMNKDTSLPISTLFKRAGIALEIHVSFQ